MFRGIFLFIYLMRILPFLFLFFASFITQAQTSKTIGTVGNKPIDNGFLQRLQIVNPDFSYTEDTTYLKAIVAKYYSKQLLMADSVKKLPVYDSLRVIIEDVKKLTEAKLLASYYVNVLMQNAIKPTDKEVTDYYQANKNKYLTTPVYSYFQAYTTSDEKDVVKTIKSSMLTAYKQDAALYPTSKKVDANFTLNFETNMPVYTTNPLYDILKTTKIGEVSGPHVLPGRKEKLYLLVTVNQPETIKPLAEVKADIQNTLSNIKRGAIEKAITDKANAAYPITFK